MKNLLFLLGLITGSILSAQHTYVPDDNFENYLETHDANGNAVAVGDPNSMGNGSANDDYVTTANISGVTSLVIGGINIADMTGIEDFAALQYLDCNGNLLTALDLSQNTNLQTLLCFDNQLSVLNLGQNIGFHTLYCENNQFTTLNISQNTGLQTLSCSGNQLSTLDVSQNTALQNLNCSYNQLTALDVSQNTVLQYLHCSYNQLTDLDITNNTALITLVAHSNALTSIDLSQNTQLTGVGLFSNNLISIDLSNNPLLTQLGIRDNKLSSLDLSNNTSLVYLQCEYNRLQSLDVSMIPTLQTLVCHDNLLTYMNVKNGNNTNISALDFRAFNNPLLTCIESDDPAWSTTNWTQIDPQTNFNSSCPTVVSTYVPDDNFENYLETHDANGNTVPVGDPNSMGNGTANDDYVLTNNISTVTILDINSQSISDLTGLQNFVSLEIFTASYNPLGTVNLSSNMALTDFNCFNCQLTSVNTSQNYNLKRLYVDNNQLTALDVTSNQLLEELYVTNNQLTSLNTVQNGYLIHFNCNNNLITSLDVLNSPALQSFNCQNNQLTSLDMRNNNNTALTTFNATNNPDLTCIFVDDAAYSTANWTNIDPTATFVETQAECNALALEDTGFDKHINIYPNPAKDILYVQSDGKAGFILRNTNGQILMQGKLNKGHNILKINGLSKGLYFISTTGNQTRTVKKLIIK